MATISDKEALKQRNGWGAALISAGRWLTSFGTAPAIALVCAALVAVFTFLSQGHVFFTSSVFQNIALTVSGLMLVTIAQTMLLAAAQIDISQGAIIVLSSVLGGKTILAISGNAYNVAPQRHVLLASAIGLGVALATGAAIGLTNGLLTVVIGINSLVVTLAMLGIATGAAEVITHGVDLAGLPIGLQTKFGIQTLAGIPLPAVCVVVVVAIAWVFFTRTTFGVHALAIGSNRSAAVRGGVHVKSRIVSLFVLSGLFSGAAGMIDLTRFVTTDISGHTTDALAAIGGAVIGGTRLTGGKASIVGAVFGALLAVILEVGLVVVNVEPFYQTVAIGVVLLIAVSIDRLRLRLQAGSAESS